MLIPYIFSGTMLVCILAMGIIFIRLERKHDQEKIEWEIALNNAVRPKKFPQNLPDGNYVIEGIVKLDYATHDGDKLWVVKNTDVETVHMCWSQKTVPERFRVKEGKVVSHS